MQKKKIYRHVELQYLGQNCTTEIDGVKQQLELARKTHISEIKVVKTAP